MKNKNLTFLLLGLGALFLFAKKDSEVASETKDKVSPDVVNGNNDVSKETTEDVTVVDTTETATPPKFDESAPVNKGSAPANKGVVPPVQDSPYMY